MNVNTFQQYSNMNANICKKISMNANANANTQICVFECIRMRIPNTNTPCLADSRDSWLSATIDGVGVLFVGASDYPGGVHAGGEPVVPG